MKTKKLKTFNKYGLVALRAVSLATKDEMHPVKAWQFAATQIFEKNYSSIKKCCPKSVFLGLAQTGLIKGIKPGQYTKSRENLRYAVNAFALLQKDDSLSQKPIDLWNRIAEAERKVTYNSQMDVVLALWNAGYLNNNGAYSPTRA